VTHLAARALLGSLLFQALAHSEANSLAVRQEVHERDSDGDKQIDARSTLTFRGPTKILLTMERDRDRDGVLEIDMQEVFHQNVRAYRETFSSGKILSRSYFARAGVDVSETKIGRSGKAGLLVQHGYDIIEAFYRSAKDRRLVAVEAREFRVTLEWMSAVTGKTDDRLKDSQDKAE